MKHTAYYSFLIFIISFLTQPIAHSFIDQKFLAYSTSTFQTDLESVKPGGIIWLEFHQQLKPGWHAYWKNPGDSGSAPIFDITVSEKADIGEIIYPPPQRILVADLVNYGYEDTVSYFIPITISNHVQSDRLTIEILADWLVCKEECVPEQSRFRLTLPIQPNDKQSEFYQDIHTTLKQLNNIPISPVTLTQSHELTLSTPLPETIDISDAYVFIDDNQAILPTQKQDFTIRDNQLIISLKSKQPQPLRSLSGWLELQTKDNQHHYYRFNTTNSIQNTPHQSFLTLWLALALAFIGGMLLNLMPCVFPILSLKVLSLINQKSSSYQSNLQHALAYTAGIVLCFSIIAIIIISLKTAGAQIGWGFQMQSPLFLLVMIYIVFWVALVLFDYIDFTPILPRIPVNFKMTHPLIESFATGLLITLISTPCTAPFMAPAIGFAFTQSAVEILLILLMLGFGLASPFVLFALCPSLSFFIPRSGPWLNSFKAFLGFPMLLTIVWLLWVLDTHLGKDELALVLMGLIAFGLLCWTIKTIKNKIIRVLLIGICILSIASSFYAIHQLSDKNISKSQPRFSEEKLNLLLSQNKKVFVNVTADWCINCKVNENLVLSTQTIQEYFDSNKIVYLKADWTQRDKKLGQYLASFNRYGVPLYVYYPGQNQPPTLLPQLLTTRIVIDHVSKNSTSNLVD